MKIVDERQPHNNTERFDNLSYKDIFEYEDAIYIKINTSDEVRNAVNLTSGYRDIRTMSNHNMVNPLNCSLIIHNKSFLLATPTS